MRGNPTVEVCALEANPRLRAPTNFDVGQIAIIAVQVCFEHGLRPHRRPLRVRPEQRSRCGQPILFLRRANQLHGGHKELQLLSLDGRRLGRGLRGRHSSLNRLVVHILSVQERREPPPECVPSAPLDVTNCATFGDTFEGRHDEPTRAVVQIQRRECLASLQERFGSL